MYVHDYMSVNPVSIDPDLSVGDALELLKKHSIRRLPVVSKGKVVGLVTRQDLLKASPSQASSLSIHEINYLFPKIKIKEIMTKDVITIERDAVIEEAALIMRENKIGTLLVVDNGHLEGVITESDLFKAFIDAFGLDYPGVRVVITVDEKAGELSKISDMVSALGINIISVVIGHSKDGKARLIMRLETNDVSKLSEKLKQDGYEIIV